MGTRVTDLPVAAALFGDELVLVIQDGVTKVASVAMITDRLVFDFASAQTLAIGPASVQSAPVGARVVTLTAEAPVYLAVGADPVAGPGLGSWPLDTGKSVTLTVDPASKVAVLHRNNADFTGAEHPPLLYLMPGAT